MNEEGVDELTSSLDRRRRSREQSPSISQLLKRYGSPSVSVCESRASSIVNGTNDTIGTVNADPSPIDRRPSPSIDERSSVDRQDIDRRRSITTPRNSSELSNDSQSDSKRSSLMYPKLSGSDIRVKWQVHSQVKSPTASSSKKTHISVFASTRIIYSDCFCPLAVLREATLSWKKHGKSGGTTPRFSPTFPRVSFRNILLVSSGAPRTFF
ncbi:hypothetical protein WR25_24308 [Diploscapter pachys]|uniref:Uncharacterized protein n=1 Tax=Diploscapter pachys TaxID=2018661 RepID=A0A2A2LRH2_9BILA|nr:hypothetical protein WR25_24308 [Diploscapter pachys]